MNVVIVAAARTPVGKRNGLLSRTHAVAMGAHAVKAVLERSQIDPWEVFRLATSGKE